ncbi:hypothetical protein G4G28_15225 [Massilia sp. Dwa41.01b]|uniref:hypothetical protein n=1 Tax=unclassified Massilia TaxID=2609279 RepID=UPI001602E87B|nr:MULTISPECIES: hypothetical protein [unclassified Massilia]QNA89482.1 hypothetical protein G4G28_15225 [Massilia sp. Dwa41.01b]QNB00387.1 hypothetical protein G4G31_18810 [Massilia sp. Se16.2.3]
MDPFSDLPYLVHTGRELELMVAGRKPLVVFCDAYPAEACEEIIPEQAFAPYLATGKLDKREFVELLDRPAPASYRQLKGYRCVLYSTPEENWRIDAYIEMKAQASLQVGDRPAT